MWRIPAGGGLVLLIILDFGHTLHVEVGKRSLALHDGTKTLSRNKREWIIPPAVIKEEQDNSYKNPIAKIHSDIKLDPGRRIRYSIVGRGVTEPPLGLFIINERTGEINITGIVDREEIDMFFLKGFAHDDLGREVEPPIELRVSVDDINDNSPVFTSEVFVCSVEELSAEHTLIMVLNATDADKPNTDNTKLAYKIISQEPVDRLSFYLKKDGELFTKVSTLDREQQASYFLEVEVKDRDGKENGGLAGTAKVQITVTDVNDNIPVLEKEEYEGEVEENLEGVEILRMKVFDNDQEFTDNWFARFNIISGNEGGYFQIITDEKTNEGVLIMVKEADYEVMQHAHLSVVVSNRAEYHSSIQHLVSGGSIAGGTIVGGGGSGAAGGVGKAIPIKVKVKNVLEGPVFKPRKKTFIVSEGKFIVNSIIGSYQAFDADSGKVAKHVKYAKEYDADNWFTIDAVTAEIRLIKVPDRESISVVNGSYIAKILAISEDLPGKTATGTISIDVEDINDNCPVLLNAVQTVCENSPFINLTALDMDSYPNGAPLKFTVLDEPRGNAQHWSIGKTDDNSAQLIPKNIWTGSHYVNIRITDNQGLSCPEKQVLRLVVCTCESGISACSDRLSNTSAALGGGAVALMILACLLLLLVPLLLLLCYCGSKGKGFLTVPEDGPEGTILMHNKEGPVPEDTAVMPHSIGTIGSAGAGAGAGAAAGTGMLKGSGYGMESMDGYGYEYNTKGMYNSSMYGMAGRYEDHGALITAGEMAAGSAGMRVNGALGLGSGARGQVSFGASGAVGNQAVLNEEFMRGYFYDKGILCADEDMAQAAKDCILLYSQEGTESIDGSVGCCSLIENDFEDDCYLDDLGLKFKVLADICLGVNLASDAEISKYTAYEETRQGSLMSDIDRVQKEEEVGQHDYTMETSYMSTESHVREAEPVVRKNVVVEESLVNSRFVQEPIMHGNVLVTEKTYTRAPTVFLEPVHTQNVLVTERVIRPATNLHNVLEVSDAENVMFTGRMIQSEKESSGLVGVAEAPDPQFVLVRERVLAPSSSIKAAVNIPDVSMGQSVIVTERHFTPISGVNGNVVIPAELSVDPSVVKESVSISEDGNQGRSVYSKGGFGVEVLPSSGSTIGNSTSKVTKYSKVQYSRA